MRMFKLLHYWLPVIAWMIFIFALSSRQRVEVSEVDTVNFLIFKSLHVIEYAVLYFLMFRGFYLWREGKMTPRLYLIAGIITFLYAASDEIHQTFVPTREGKVRDVAIDTLGIVLMYIYIKLNLTKIKKYLK